jgi:Cu-processing system ATP-binding protein
LTTDVLYLQDGKVIFFQSLAELKQQTGEEKLSKAIAAIMRNETRKEMSYLKIAN